MTCTSRCALPNSHLRAGCQHLRCRIPRQPLFSSAYALDEFSCLAWTFHRQAHVRQQSALPIFLWQTYSRINLRCRFIPLLAWLPAPLGTVLDSLPKCAPRACLTLLKTTSTKRTRRPRRTDSKHPYTASVPRHNPCFSHETSSFAHIQQQFNPPNFVNLFQSQAVTHSVLTR